MKRLYRTEGRDATICGVCGGIAEYFGIDPTLVRVGHRHFDLCRRPVPVGIYHRRFHRPQKEHHLSWLLSAVKPSGNGEKRTVPRQRTRWQARPSRRTGYRILGPSQGPGRNARVPCRFSQNRLCSRIARSCSPCSRLSPAKSWYSSANAVSVVSSPARRYACSRCCSAR